MRPSTDAHLSISKKQKKRGLRWEIQGIAIAIAKLGLQKIEAMAKGKTAIEIREALAAELMRETKDPICKSLPFETRQRPGSTSK